MPKGSLLYWLRGVGEGEDAWVVPQAGSSFSKIQPMQPLSYLPPLRREEAGRPKSRRIDDQAAPAAAAASDSVSPAGHISIRTASGSEASRPFSSERPKSARRGSRRDPTGRTRELWEDSLTISLKQGGKKVPSPFRNKLRKHALTQAFCSIWSESALTVSSLHRFTPKTFFFRRQSSDNPIVVGGHLPMAWEWNEEGAKSMSSATDSARDLWEGVIAGRNEVEGTSFQEITANPLVGRMWKTVRLKKPCNK
ncbi:hypothetical protein DFJ73DRAFT_759998 [Zopfochytrium polystomum]|nr:hypothetical protein DFJ73DRAFT_759998 [Zopfochytrium polystomum]